MAKNAAKFLKRNLGFAPIPCLPLDPSGAQRMGGGGGEPSYFPSGHITSRPETSVAPAAAATVTKRPRRRFSFSYQSAEIIFIRKMKFSCIYIFYTIMPGHFCCLGSYVQVTLHTHFKPHSLKQFDKTLNKKIKDILREDDHSIRFLYRRKVLSRRVLL